MSPGLGEVGIHVGLEGITSETLVGGEDLLGGSLGTLLIEEEMTSGLAFVGFLAIIVFLAGFLLDGVSGEHGSHEDVIITSSEMGGELSVVFGILLILGLPSVVETITGELDLSIIVISDFRVHGNELANWDTNVNLVGSLDVRSVGVLLSSLVGLRGSVISEETLNVLLSSVIKNGFELPDLLGGVKDDTSSSSDIVGTDKTK